MNGFADAKIMGKVLKLLPNEKDHNYSNILLSVEYYSNIFLIKILVKTNYIENININDCILVEGRLIHENIVLVDRHAEQIQVITKAEVAKKEVSEQMKVITEAEVTKKEVTKVILDSPKVREQITVIAHPQVRQNTREPIYNPTGAPVLIKPVYKTPSFSKSSQPTQIAYPTQLDHPIKKPDIQDSASKTPSFIKPAQLIKNNDVQADIYKTPSFSKPAQPPQPTQSAQSAQLAEKYDVEVKKIKEFSDNVENRNHPPEKFISSRKQFRTQLDEFDIQANKIIVDD